MNRSRTIAILTECKPRLQKRFGVLELALFGSTARDDARSMSDVDVLVKFAGPATFLRYFGVQFTLEDALGCAVDLVTDKAFRAELRPHVERDAMHV